MSFKYTIEEIDEFRNLLRFPVHSGYSRIPSTEEVEAQIRTYMTAGTRPAELRAQHERQRAAAAAADAQRLAKELIHYCQYDGQSIRAIWTLQDEAHRRAVEEQRRGPTTDDMLGQKKYQKKHWWS